MEVFEAIGDAVRREILVALAHEGALSAGEIAGRFAISRPAVSRHLRVLRESGVVHDEVSGRRRIYRLAADGLEPLRAWLAELTPQPDDAVWSARFDALDTEVRRTRRDRSRGAPTGGAAETTTPPETTRETA
ncbi:MAG TPA: metalloregulator ArsR/SmtB family transcription factor [Microlunatus sp.]|nr:metalloregulator ArsR/SmtB family transcription factor [Microlunatus sp.]